MQISRHWRMKALRYRLEGVQHNNGVVSLQERPAPQEELQVGQTVEVRAEERQPVGAR
jgi:hypothetical protein